MNRQLLALIALLSQTSLASVKDLPCDVHARVLQRKTEGQETRYRLEVVQVLSVKEAPSCGVKKGTTVDHVLIEGTDFKKGEVFFVRAVYWSAMGPDGVVGGYEFSDPKRLSRKTQKLR